MKRALKARDRVLRAVALGAPSRRGKRELGEKALQPSACLAHPCLPRTFEPRSGCAHHAEGLSSTAQCWTIESGAAIVPVSHPPLPRPA